jgi:TLD/Rab-GTPase-TBC domain
MLRKGVPPVLRCAVWLSNIVATVHPHQPSEYSQEYRTLAKVRALDMAYENLLRRTLPNPGDNPYKANSWKDMKIPSFGTDIVNYQNRVPIAVKRVLIGLDQVIGVIEYSPVLPTLCELLLTHMSESYAFCAIREMAHAPSWYFPSYHREYAAWVNAFCDILERLHPSSAKFYKSKGVWDVPGMAPIFRYFFTTLLPREHVLRILDIYTLEGSKVIFRFGVALLVLFKMDQSGRKSSRYFGSSKEVLDSSHSVSQIELVDTRKKENEADAEANVDVWEGLKQWAHNDQFNFEFLVKKAYGVHGTRQPRRFPRQSIITRIIKIEEERLLDDPTFDSTNVGPPCPLAISDPFVHPELDRDELGNYDKKPPDAVLAQPAANRIMLASWLPLSLRMSTLELLFSTNHHGRTLSMFYSRVMDFKHTILLAEVFQRGSSADDPRTIIGCYASQAWRVSTGVYGDGQCILFRLSPDPKHWKWSPRNITDDITLEVARTNGKSGTSSGNGATTSDAKNAALLQWFQVGTSNYISMGGNPDGSCGLRFNEDFTRCESAPAVGFDNEPLAGIKGDLDIGLVEVYGLQSPTF